LDERSAAYFALGMSRALREAVAIICTSGTAAANFYPAIVEAHYSHLPLLVLTADRPHELWEWGSNQTIDQNRMYAEHVKWFVNMATPDPTPELLRYARETACRAVATARESPPGPVHVNFPFREPLVPERIPATFHGGRTEGRPHTEVGIGRSQFDKDKLAQVAKKLQERVRGIIVCGPQYDPEFPASIAGLASKIGFPILADPLSQVRCGTHDRTNVIDCYDGFLRSERAVQALGPELVLRFGATPTSKVLLNFLTKQQDAEQICVYDGDWQDPDHTATGVFRCNPTNFAQALTEAIPNTKSTEWLELWLKVASRSHSTIAAELKTIEEIFEGKIFSELSNQLPSKAALFAGNSMPVRDLDAFYPTSPQEIRFLGNRGASGIDGVLSTSLGVAAVSQHPLITVLGDLSFYHDMNGLLAAKQFKLNATIVVLNNNGGGIFSFLPQHRHPEYFEKYFVTPHDLTFEAAANLYGINYNKVNSWPDFRQVISNRVSSTGSRIVEVSSNRERNVELHHRISSAVVKAAEQVIAERF
jgi:2-succinyl-5-enolpyruvyl-6-hydroxy-3-cyclohexene-1-carboxylate synthase